MSASPNPSINMEKVPTMQKTVSESPGEMDDSYISPEDEKKLLRKLDIRLAPIFAMLYFLSYLNRSNIGNAEVAGMTTQLGMTSSQYSTSVSVFYATYVGLIFPLVLALRKMQPHRAMTVMSFAWSIVTIGTAFVKTYHQLLACRLLLGACEAGFFPCISLYMTMVYNRKEQGRRFAYLFSAMAISGMFGGLIATGITYIHEVGGLKSWSWLYIIEGLISVLVVPWVWFGLPSQPAMARFWSDHELDLMRRREMQRREYMGDARFDWAQVRSALAHWRTYVAAAVQFFQDVVLYGFSTFLPSILKSGLGYSSLQAQYLSVPVYALGGISFFTASLVGDRYGLRGSVLFFLDIFALIGYLIILFVPANGVKYFACYLISIPLYCGAGINETWIVNNSAPHYRRATALGISQAIGNLAGVVSGQVYRSAPYKLGHWFSFGCVLLAMICIAIQLAYFRALNRKKDLIANGTIPDDRTELEGENNLEFRYVY
ncbi:hypothetical protein SEUCBS139899_006341 [Sporothrix eucalyptigena]|uniref:Major facilitator superfamily (MFS) profile domain-containing protein n=1 Tax=Sporothrix eucalyptigena TaxID=1812306 RepID=A0ABP0C060_9PEZI